MKFKVGDKYKSDESCLRRKGQGNAIRTVIEIRPDGLIVGRYANGSRERRYPEQIVLVTEKEKKK